MDANVKQLPAQARLLWAKTPNERAFARGRNDCDADAWLPLCMHMADCAETAVRLWDTWLPSGVKALICGCGDAVFGKKLFKFLAAAHDLGKATPAFQQKSESLAASLAEYGKLSVPHMTDRNKIPHGLAGHAILMRSGFDESLAVVVGGHHGKPPTYGNLRAARSHNANTGFGDPAWIAVQDALLDYACALSGLTKEELKRTRALICAQALLTGLVIMTDWIASDESRFSYIPLLQFQADSSFQRASSAWADLRLSASRNARESLCVCDRDAGDFFRARFGVESPRPVQTAVFRALSEAKAPGIVVIEAPMGEGKTEAALAAAEILSEKSGRSGVFVGLPTMATSDGMFGRVKQWADALGRETGENRSMYLAHGKAHLNDEYRGLKTKPNVGDGGEDSAVANSWFQGRKKGVLADLAVGTVDQLLFMALKMRHVALRHLAFACKTIIVDEVHAYDAYMNQYLHRALEWLGAYRVPVVILSATLPCTARQKLVEAYFGARPAPSAPVETPLWLRPAPQSVETPSWLRPAGGLPEAPRETPREATRPPVWAERTDYPLITYSDGDDIKQAAPAAAGRPKAVLFEYLQDEALPDKLEELLSGGGCAGLILDTVGRAQETARLLEARFAGTDVELIHSRFLAIDRARKEKALRDALGPPEKAARRPKRLIAVGTQVIEQSLDIDFDVLISDIAPMDLLLQRVGRLHRHTRARPERLAEARCFVTGVRDVDEWLFNPVIEKIYNRYALLHTLRLLPVSPDRVNLPGDISPLVQAAYAESNADGAAGADTSPGRDTRTEAESAPAERPGLADGQEKVNAAMTPERRADLDKARAAHEANIYKKEERAKVFRLRPPVGADKTLLNWLDIEQTEDKAGHRAAACVRDIADSVEVMIVQRKPGGRLCLLPWIGDERRGVAKGAEIATDCVPEDDVARVAAACTVSLPPGLCVPQLIDKVINELESKACVVGIDEWQKSQWLEGLLPLILDEDLKTEILYHSVKYCDKMGLSSSGSSPAARDPGAKER
jgi:CRISPR-associated endonuclease/helicase Cas3